MKMMCLNERALPGMLYEYKISMKIRCLNNNVM